MINISSNNPEISILSFVKNWMKLLSENCFQEACDLLDEPNNYGMVWTQNSILAIVNDTFNTDTSFHLNHPEGIIFTNPYQLKEQIFIEVRQFNDNSGYGFDYDVPLNHEWSDLTAQFEFLKKENGYAVILQDLHVL